MQDKHWDSNPRCKVTVGTWTQGRLGVKGEELSKEGTLSKAQVMVYGPEFTEGISQGKVYAITTDANKWTPNQDSKVIKMFSKPKIKGYRHYERTSSPIQYMHVEPDNYIALWRTHIENVLLHRLTKAIELAAKEADQMQRPWQELVPHEYRHFGKVFSNEEAQQFPGKRPWDHAIDLVEDAPPMLNCKIEGMEDRLHTCLHAPVRMSRVLHMPDSAAYHTTVAAMWLEGLDG